MDKKINRLREKRVVLTIQRIAVLEALDNLGTHPTAEAIYKKLARKYPTLSLATIYNTMQVLRDAGEIKELNIGRGKRFDPITAPHHHLHCRICECILDLEISCPIAEKGWIDSHRVESVQTVFSGVCCECLKAEDEDA